MPFRVAVIGAGWYGCHIASSLASLGFSVTVFERRHRPLHEASGNNQFRLHLGFHYARHHATRQQSRDGFLRFVERYPDLSAEVPENVYAVPRGESLLDFATYRLVMVSSGIDFVELPGGHPLLRDIEGALLTKERVLLIGRAREFFARRLGPALRLGCAVTQLAADEAGVTVNGEAFDYAVDASWGHHLPLPIPVYYEPTLLLYYEARAPHPAITFVDGPLPSVYPTEDPAIFTLSSVTHTPLGRFARGEAARAALEAVDSALVEQRRAAMEAQIAVNLPGFRDAFRFAGVQLAIKTKPEGRADDRSCTVFQQGRVFCVLSGKVDTIFFATERILSLIEAQHSLAPIAPAPGLREDILQPRP